MIDAGTTGPALGVSADGIARFLSFARSHWRDGLDLVVLASVFYWFFRTVRGTRSAQMLVGVMLVVGALVAATWFRLTALTAIGDSLRAVWLILFVMIFQPELRQALASLGGGRLFYAFTRGKDYLVLGELARAVEALSEHHTGALIVIERGVGLKNYVETGTGVGGRVSSQLLTTIFTPPSPLHDGAIIISRGEIAAAGCILPLSQNPRLVTALGTRHRAALGISEETDAVAVVVSEETGQVSIAERGRLLRNQDPTTLRSTLSAFLRPVGRKRREPRGVETPPPPALVDDEPEPEVTVVEREEHMQA